MQGIFDPLTDAQDLFLATQFSQLQQHLCRKKKLALDSFKETKRVGLKSPFQLFVLPRIWQLTKDGRNKALNSENSSRFQHGEMDSSQQQQPDYKLISESLQAAGVGNHKQGIYYFKRFHSLHSF